MEQEKEWKVLRHGVTWSDRFKSEERAIDHMNECMEENNEPGSDYDCMEMTDEEIRAYTHPEGIYTPTGGIKCLSKE